MARNDTGSAVILAPGPRAAEAALLARVESWSRCIAGDFGELVVPVRVVVPSRVLRDHLAAALVARTRNAVAGVQVQTLMGLAQEVLDRAGRPSPPPGVLLEVLVRRFARRHELLNRLLGGLEDGFGAVAPAVRDLLDAGLLPDHRESVAELLAAGGGNRVWRDRGAAVVEVAAACADVLQALGGGRQEAALTEAAELLARRDKALLPSRAVLVYGFAETTAVAGDLLEVLVRYCGATVLIDLPPDPAQPQEVTPGAEFAARLQGRLAGGGGAVSTGPGEPPAPQMELVAAAGPDGEVRAVANRIAALLQDGVVPETVAVVSRNLGPHLVPIRRHFSRLGIPFSGISAAAPPSPGESRLEAFLTLLERGVGSPVGCWLEVLARVPGRQTPGVPWELELGLRALGTAVLEDAATLPVEEVADVEGVPLPVRRGLFEAEDVDVMGRPEYLRRCRLGKETLAAAVTAAGELAAALTGWPNSCSLTDHLARLDRVVAALGVSSGDELAMCLIPMVDSVREEIPGGFELARGEVVLLLRETARSGGRPPAGGRGGGVRVLSVTEYRGCTSGHLFLMGLNRDVFPRAITEDPLLPDAVRSALRPLLPDLAVKAEGHAEERYLFAQALASSPRVTLSWQGRDDEGNARPASPLVERLRLECGLDVAVSPAWPPVPQCQAVPLTAAEAAVLGGVTGHRDIWQKLLTAAVVDAQRVLGGGPDAVSLGAARRRVLDELEPDGRTAQGRVLRESLGPYWGFVGAGSTGEGDVAVTFLENLAACPWQAFLVRRLGLDPPPLGGGVPGVDALLVGRAVHEVLERVVMSHRDAVAAGEEPSQVPWPEREALDELAAAVCRAQAREAGVPALADLLAVMVRPCLDLARDLDWGEEPPRVAGVEVAGSVGLAGGNSTGRRVHFRVDRVDVRPDGTRVYTDYKTGKPMSGASGEDTRRKHLLAAVGSGERLQAAAYAAAGGVGRYLFLGGLNREWPERIFSVSPDDREAREAFEAAADAVLAAWGAGALPPRLVDSRDSEPAGCGYCQVAEACLRGDTGARSRFLAWARRRGTNPQEPLEIEEEAAYRVWLLKEREARGGRGDTKP